MNRIGFFIVCISMVFIGCAKKPEPPRSVPFSPGPPQQWDIGELVFKHPLPDDGLDQFMEIRRTPGFSIGMLTTKQNISLRSHENHDMAIYVHAGSSRFQVGEKSFFGSTGDAIFIPRGARYTASSMSEHGLQLFVVYSPPFDGNDIIYYEDEKEEE